jgi:hypothetical protein
LFLNLAYNSYFSCSDDEEPPICATAIPPPSPVAVDEPVEPDVAPRTTRASVKKVSQAQARNQKRAKKTKEAKVSLEAHVSTVSSDDVSDSFFPSFLSCTSILTLFYFLSGFGAKIYHPGHGVCGVPKGCKSFRRYNCDIHLIPFFCIFSFSFFLSSFCLLLQLL